MMRRKGKNNFFVASVIYSSAVVSLVFIIFSFIESQGKNSYSDNFLKTLEGPIIYNDPTLLRYIRNEILVPPSDGSYNLEPHPKDLYVKGGSEQFYHDFATKVFNSTTRGFFVEAGAFDGDRMSNTLWLEKHRGWTGLLVEPDPSNYKVLLSKNRKVWSANACLSIEKYPKKELLSSLAVVKGKTDKTLRSMGSIFRDSGKEKGLTSEDHFNSYYSSQCFPLGSFLLALNVTKIDLLSLDVEFVEEFILRNFDFDQFDVQVLFIEFYTAKRKAKFHEFLMSKGFEFVANKGGDMIYCKSGTEVAKRVLAHYPSRTFILNLL